MTKYKRYQDYVIKDGKLVGEFEEMYQDFDDPWEQSERERFASEKAVCINLIESLPIQNVVELGCGFGQLTNRIQKVCPSVTGLDLSPTAIKKTSTFYPNCNFLVSEFPDLDLLRKLKPDCIVMAEITWYVLDQLDGFIEFLRDEMPNTYLIHMLMTYAASEQKYGTEKFTNLSKIKEYFGMNYIESGEVQHKKHNGGQRTYFIGRFSWMSEWYNNQKKPSSNFWKLLQERIDKSNPRRTELTNEETTKLAKTEGWKPKNGS